MSFGFSAQFRRFAALFLPTIYVIPRERLSSFSFLHHSFALPEISRLLTRFPFVLNDGNGPVIGTVYQPNPLLSPTFYF